MSKLRESDKELFIKIILEFAIEKTKQRVFRLEDRVDKLEEELRRLRDDVTTSD